MYRKYCKDQPLSKNVKLNRQLAELRAENAELRRLNTHLTNKVGLNQAKWAEIVGLRRACESLILARERLLEQHKKQKSHIAFLTYLSCFSLGLLGFLLIVMFGS